MTLRNPLRRVADWCVPASALRWGWLTTTDERPSVYIGRDGRGTAYVADQRWPVEAGRSPGGLGSETWMLVTPSREPTLDQLLADWDRDRPFLLDRDA